MNLDHIQSPDICVAVITVSTTRTTETDVSGNVICSLLSEAGLRISQRIIVSDRIDRIQDALQNALLDSNCIIFCGGTGLTRDDCTIEAVSPFIEKRIDGFGEIFRWRSYQEIGTPAILSRALGGIIDKKAVFCIPGSPDAARLAVRSIILPEIAHILTHAGR